MINRTSCLFSIYAALAVICICLLPAKVQSHALDPESIDRYAELTLTASRLVVVYEVILGLLPTERATNRLDADNDGEIIDPERTRFIQAIAGEYAEKQSIRLGEKELKLQFKLGDAYSTIGHNGINVIKIDIGYVSPFPADLTRGATIPFDYSDSNFKEISGWKQLKLLTRNDVRYEGHVPYADYKPFDYEIINTMGFYPSTDSLHVKVNVPVEVQEKEPAINLPEKKEVKFIKTGETWEIWVMTGVVLFVLAVIVAVYLQFRQT